MKLASVSDRIHAAGAEVMAVVVDSEERNAAMFARWPTPHVQYVSDPGGERVLQRMAMFDPDERGGIALPGLFVIDPAGNEVFGYRGRDFADRTHDDDLFDALEALELGPIDAPDGGPILADVEVEQKGAFTPKLYGPYFSGNKFAAIAIGRRAETDEAKSLAREHSEMAQGMLDAWAAVNAAPTAT